MSETRKTEKLKITELKLITCDDDESLYGLRQKLFTCTNTWVIYLNNKLDQTDSYHL